MADSRSGARQTLQIRPAGGGNYKSVAAPGKDSGFSGLNLNYTPATFENKSGGLTTTHYAGTVVAAGDFTINENEDTLPLLLGANGQRFDVQWLREAGGLTLEFEAIATISRTFEDRGKRTFGVALAVDGEGTES